MLLLLLVGCFLRQRCRTLWHKCWPTFVVQHCWTTTCWPTFVSSRVSAVLSSLQNVGYIGFFILWELKRMMPFWLTMYNYKGRFINWVLSKHLFSGNFPPNFGIPPQVGVVLARSTGASKIQRLQWRQESWAIAKMTARCALCMGAMKIFRSHWLGPWLLFSNILMGFCSDWAYKCACKIWRS